MLGLTIKRIAVLGAVIAICFLQGIWHLLILNWVRSLKDWWKVCVCYVCIVVAIFDLLYRTIMGLYKLIQNTVVIR